MKTYEALAEEKIEVLGENLHQSHFVHHKAQMLSSYFIFIVPCIIIFY